MGRLMSVLDGMADYSIRDVFTSIDWRETHPFFWPFAFLVMVAMFLVLLALRGVLFVAHRFTKSC